MAIYKIGSSGPDVKKIQQMLRRVGYAVTADGVYGQKTAEAVMAFQRKIGLKPVDGIVGSVTMAQLIAYDAQAQQPGNGLHIIQEPIQTHITFSVWRPLKYIAIHYTAGSSSGRGMAMQTRNVFLKRSASADFVVDNEQIVQVNPDIRNYYCWAVGDKKNIYSGGGQLYGIATNKNTINIEICSNLRAGTTASVPNHDGWYFTDKALDLAARLVRHLMQQYGIPKSNVVRHYDISGKPCPGVVGWNDAVLYTMNGKQTTFRNNSEKWLAFKGRL